MQNKEFIAEKISQNSPAIYGAAYFLNLETAENIIGYIVNCIASAKFFAPDSKAKEIAETAAAIIAVDTQLYEAYLGCRFSYFDNISEEECRVFANKYQMGV